MPSCLFSLSCIIFYTQAREAEFLQENAEVYKDGGASIWWSRCLLQLHYSKPRWDLEGLLLLSDGVAYLGNDSGTAHVSTNFFDLLLRHIRRLGRPMDHYIVWHTYLTAHLVMSYECNLRLCPSNLCHMHKVVLYPCLQHILHFVIIIPNMRPDVRTP